LLQEHHTPVLPHLSTKLWTVNVFFDADTPASACKHKTACLALGPNGMAPRRAGEAETTPENKGQFETRGLQTGLNFDQSIRAR
jgi:hypothetical protein